MQATNDSRVTVGIGKADVAKKVVIRWPSGIVQTLENLKADQEYKVVEAQVEEGVEPRGIAARPTEQPWLPPASRFGRAVGVWACGGPHDPADRSAPPYASSRTVGDSLMRSEYSVANPELRYISRRSVPTLFVVGSSSAHPFGGKLFREDFHGRRIPDMALGPLQRDR